MTPLYSQGARCAMCLLNWNTSEPVIDDGSYENWLEGTRLLQAALGFLPIGVQRVATWRPDAESLEPLAAIESLRAAGVERALVAGNHIESDVLAFAGRLLAVGIEPVILFDVCGTQDPMAKWQCLAAMVDRGAKVSTVQQTLRGMINDLEDPAIQSRLIGLLNEGLGEHAFELSAA